MSKFVNQFERRVKQALKERKLKRNEKVHVKGELAEYLVKKFVHFPVNFGKKGVVIEEWTLDDECVGFLAEFSTKFKPEKNSIKILKYVSDKEAKKYAALKGVKFKPNKKDKIWQDFLNQFEEQMKRCLLRNAGEIKSIWKQSRT